MQFGAKSYLVTKIKTAIVKSSENETICNEVLKKIQHLGFMVSPKLELGQSVWMLNDEIDVEIMFSKQNRRKEYVFKPELQGDVSYKANRNAFQLYVCDTIDRTFVIPLSLIAEIFQDIYALGEHFKQFKPIIQLQNGAWFLSFFGKYDITDYLNRYDFLIAESKTYTPPPVRYATTIERKGIEDRYKELAQEGNLRDDSMHATTVDMLRRIGEWYGFEAITESKPKGFAEFPYLIDCLWYKNGDLYMAIEVCHKGVVEKDKDALKLAKQHGARKVIIVAEVNKLDRIRKLFMYDGDIKSWTEIWSFERVFNLFESGLRFFKDFEKLKRYGWSENLIEYI
ncbi:MAG: hypothetical protein RIS64_695 [Bacteroidota bacterium]